MQRTLKFDQGFFPIQVFSVLLSLDSVSDTFVFMNGSFVAPGELGPSIFVKQNR